MKRRTLRSEAKKPKAQVSVSSQSQEMKFDFHSFKQTVMTVEGQVKRCGAVVGGEKTTTKTSYSNACKPGRG